MAPRIQAVVFDMDDTLYPESQFVRGALRDAGELLDRVLPSPVGAAAFFLDVLDRTGPWRVFDTALPELGVTPDPSLIRSLVRAFRNHHPTLLPFPGIPELLCDLRAEGLLLAVVTDGYVDVQRRKWDALGLAGHFQEVVFTGDVDGVSWPKPSPVPYRWLEERLGFHTGAVLSIGDNPAKDFPPADELGWQTIRVRFPDGFHAGASDSNGNRLQAASVRDLELQIRGFL